MTEEDEFEDDIVEFDFDDEVGLEALAMLEGVEKQQIHQPEKFQPQRYPTNIRSATSSESRGSN
ncbi:hypothetical protein HK102_013944, partial [Quaeritorhiza haematococci]